MALPGDLRDVVVDGDVLLVSRFRSAEVLTVDAQGRVLARHLPPDRPSQRFVGSRDPNQPRVPGEPAGPRQTRMEAGVAWRLVGWRQGEAILLHQRALADDVVVQPGGYGSPCGGIVESVISGVGPLAALTAAPTLAPSAAVVVDVAISPDGRKLVAVSPANARSGGAQLFQASIDSLREPGVDCPRGPGGAGGKPPSGAGGTAGGGPPPGGTEGELPVPIELLVQPSGEATAVAFDPRGHILVQTREPASLQIVTAHRTILLSRESRDDTGHAIFHANSGSGLACASCHPEALEDGRTWKFRDRRGTLEVRRTQNLSGSIAATAPFHWNGDLRDLGALMDEVFATRMNGPLLEPEQVGTLSRWLDAVPALPTPAARDAASVQRGRALFHDDRVACATCHAGPLLTNNMTVDVGTGKPLQVPTLRGLRWRPPFMHDGCAPTLTDRFTPGCGGGDRHGVTSHLTADQIADLVSFMDTL